MMKKTKIFSIFTSLFVIVGTIFLYSCSKTTNEVNPTSSKKVSGNKNGSTQFIEFQVPQGLASTTGIVAEVKSREVTYSESSVTVTGTSRVSLDAQGKVVKMELSKNIFDTLELNPGDFLGYEGRPYELQGACSCSQRRGYWAAYRASLGWSADSVRDALMAAQTWDALFGWIFGCYEKDPGNC
jgi:hypothetical protein